MKFENIAIKISIIYLDCIKIWQFFRVSYICKNFTCLKIIKINIFISKICKNSDSNPYFKVIITLLTNANCIMFIVLFILPAYELTLCVWFPNNDSIELSFNRSLNVNIVVGFLSMLLINYLKYWFPFHSSPIDCIFCSHDTHTTYPIQTEPNPTLTHTLTLSALTIYMILNMQIM